MSLPPMLCLPRLNINWQSLNAHGWVGKNVEWLSYCNFFIISEASDQYKAPYFCEGNAKFTVFKINITILYASLLIIEMYIFDQFSITFSCWIWLSNVCFLQKWYPVHFFWPCFFWYGWKTRTSVWQQKRSWTCKDGMNSDSHSVTWRWGLHASDIFSFSHHRRTHTSLAAGRCNFSPILCSAVCNATQYDGLCTNAFMMY